jgi:hypothetical protein
MIPRHSISTVMVLFKSGVLKHDDVTSSDMVFSLNRSNSLYNAGLCSWMRQQLVDRAAYKELSFFGTPKQQHVPYSHYTQAQE